MKFSIITLSLITLVTAAPAAAPQSGEISYGALKHDGVPCSLRGASAANCRPGAEANPYNRGCSAIEKCRGGVGNNFGYWNGLDGAGGSEHKETASYDRA
ncbi:hypothetical protein CEK26_007811 [Fusarium fujikuroi]|uniref:Uncharacterized protein n=2 Tax=Fusarium fujikuroi species complex TaxID=171627 RepID=A0A5Q3FTZ3_FUSFU|nr:hypothetical protein CEK27_007831 [Fusarium fujikuroi]QGI81130.1 hypothetical protein CEK25_007859 [Fusarium fujikuroi]QGI94742.1 hypothetical protein CEK26_007811 [Fusarium fujikuroi]VTT64470.1 unnamed protein product [Fusarium fujikuroi]VTT82772.1 unnamed protein product [Fusarium fujikuroi]